MTFSLGRLFAAWIRPRTPFERAVRLLDRGDAPGALAALDACLRETRDDRERARIHNKRGVAHLRLGDRAAAIGDWNAALALDARFAPAMTNLGNLRLEDGELAEAIEHYQAAIRADETYPLAHLNLGVAYRRLGRRAEAVREMRLAHRLEGRRGRNS